MGRGGASRFFEGDECWLILREIVDLIYRQSFSNYCNLSSHCITFASRSRSLAGIGTCWSKVVRAF